MPTRAFRGLAWMGYALLVACTSATPVPTLPRPAPAQPAPPRATAPAPPTVVLAPATPATTTVTSRAVPTGPPTPIATATARPTVLPTLRPPAPTATAAPPPSAGSCHETQGRLSVAQLDSAVLGRRVAYSIYVPPCYDADLARRYPTLYLLHGANADQTQWPDLNVAPDADRLIAQQAIAPLVVVMPGGTYQPDEDYAAFVLRDLLPQVAQTTRVASSGSQRAIGGLSLGGWWALTIAAAHPDLFSAVGGHSPATDSALAQRLARRGATAGPRIYLDVGRADSLAPGVTTFANALTAAGLHPIFHLYPGTHTRPYWRAHTAEYLRFYAAPWATR